MLKNNPSGRFLVSVKSTTPFVPWPISIFVLSPCLSLSLLYSVSLSVPQSDPFLSLVHHLPFCLGPRVHRGHQTMAAIQLLHASCADWHRRDGSAHVVPGCCRVHLEGRDNRRPKHSTKWISRPQPYLFICLWAAVMDFHGYEQDNMEDDLIKSTAGAAKV